MGEDENMNEGFDPATDGEVAEKLNREFHEQGGADGRSGGSANASPTPSAGMNDDSANRDTAGTQSGPAPGFPGPSSAPSGQSVTPGNDVLSEEGEGNGTEDEREAESPGSSVFTVNGALPPVKLPEQFAMDTPGILTCRTPVTPEDIRNLRKFVDEHRSELVLSGQWQDPVAVSFSTRDPVTREYAAQVFTPSLAEALSEEWKISRVEARAGSLRLVAGNGGESPLDHMKYLSHIHMWGGFSLNSDTREERMEQNRLLATSRAMHYSVGVTGSMNRVAEGILANRDVLSISATGNRGVLDIGDNAFAGNSVFRNIGAGVADRSNGRDQDEDAEGISSTRIPQTERINVSSFRDVFRHFVDSMSGAETPAEENRKKENAVTWLTGVLNGLDTDPGLNSALPSEERERLSAIMKREAGEYLLPDAENSAQMSNEDFARALADRMTTPVIKDFDPEALKKALTSDTALVSANVPEENRESTRKSLSRIIDDLVNSRGLPADVQSKEVQSALSNNRVFSSLVFSNGIASELFDTARLEAEASVKQMPSSLFAEIVNYPDGTASPVTFRVMNTNDEARHDADRRNLDSLNRNGNTVFSDTRTLDETTVPENESDAVRTGLMNLESLVKAAIQPGTDLIRSEMAENILADFRLSAEMSKMGDGGKNGRAGKSVVLGTGFALGTGSLAGTDASFYNGAGKKDFLTVKLASEFLEQVSRVKDYVGSMAEKYEAMKEEKKNDPVFERDYMAVKSIAENFSARTRPDGPALTPALENVSHLITKYRDNYNEQKKLLEDAFCLASVKGVSPREFQEQLRQYSEHDADTLSTFAEDENVPGEARKLAKICLMEKNAEKLKDEFIGGMEEVYGLLSEAIVPTMTVKAGPDSRAMSIFDDDGNEALDENGEAVQVRMPIFDNTDRVEFSSRFFAGFNGIENVPDENGELSDREMITDIKAKWMSFSHFAGLEGNDPAKAILVPVGSDLGRASLEGTGITAVAGERESMYRHDFEKLDAMHGKVCNETALALDGLRDQLVAMGAKFPASGITEKYDWEKTFMPAFETLMADGALLLQADSKKKIEAISKVCHDACSMYARSAEWKSRNPNLQEYMMNRSPQGILINREIERLERRLKQDGLGADEIRSLQAELAEKKEKKADFIRDGMRTLTHGEVSGEVRNVDLSLKQCTKGKDSFKNAYYFNETNGGVPELDPDSPPWGDRMRGQVSSMAESTAEVLKEAVLHYHHMTMTETAANLIYLGGTIVTHIGKNVFGFMSHAYDKAKQKKAMALNIAAPMLDMRNKDREIVFDHASDIGLDVLKFRSPEAERNALMKGVTLVQNRYHTDVCVDLNIATGGEYSGKVKLGGVWQKLALSQGQMMKFADKEEMKARQNRIDRRDNAKIDRSIKFINRHREKRGKEKYKPNIKR